jgi:steroid 5-alpha reductase family enzyme
MKLEITAREYSKKTSAFICMAAYGTALAAAAATVLLMKDYDAIVAAFCADAAATMVIFIFSVALNNSSMYDPYWSVAPLPIAIYWAMGIGGGSFSIRGMAVMLLVAAWGGRLTYNWYRQWKGLVHEDWRYADFRNKTGSFYWPVSFLGIHFFPTVMVFLGCLSMYPVMRSSSTDLRLLDGVALVISGGAIIIEMIADKQLNRFVSSHPPREAILDSGLWAYSRHPNYFGEISFWWGLFIFSLAADGFHWWAIIGPLAITIMFLTVSIPMMEKRMLSRRPHYAERQRSVSMLIPWFPKSK